jgi:hypothetical protein
MPELAVRHGAKVGDCVFQVFCWGCNGFASAADVMLEKAKF